MTPTESVTLCRLAAAACPQQAIDEWTPDIWHELMMRLAGNTIAYLRAQVDAGAEAVQQSVGHLRRQLGSLGVVGGGVRKSGM